MCDQSHIYPFPVACQIFRFIKRSWISGFLYETSQFSNTGNNLTFFSPKSGQTHQNYLWPVTCVLPTGIIFLSADKHGLTQSQTFEQRLPRGSTEQTSLSGKSVAVGYCQIWAHCKCFLLVLSNKEAGSLSDTQSSVPSHLKNETRMAVVGVHFLLKPGRFTPGHPPNHIPL